VNKSILSWVGLTVALTLGFMNPSLAAGKTPPKPEPPPDVHPIGPEFQCSQYPIQISQPGSYKLIANIDLSAIKCNQTAIQVNVPNVTINLNGYSIIGNCDPGNGCTCSGAPEYRGIDATDQNQLVVYNGTVTQFFDDGISASAHCKVEEVRVFNNCGEGIICSEASLIKDNTVADNDGCGVEAEEGSFVVGNVVTDNGNGECGFSFEFDQDNGDTKSTGYRSNVIKTSRACPDVIGGASMGENICDGGTPF
jgi:hypothetical protein